MPLLPTLIAALTLGQSPGQEPVRQVAMKDESIDMGLAILKELSKDEANLEARTERYRAFVSGYFMWRAMQFVIKPFTKLEIVHINASLQVLDFWAPESSAKWKPYHDRLAARPASDTKMPADAEEFFRKQIRGPIWERYVVNFDPATAPSDVQRDEFMAGITLGELSSLMVTQYTTGGHSVVRKELGRVLKSIREYVPPDKADYRRKGMTKDFWQKWDGLGQSCQDDVVPFEKYDAVVTALHAVQAEAVKLR